MNTKVKFDLNSVKFRLWMYFVILTLIIVGLVLILQTMFLDYGYEAMKIKEVDEVGDLMGESFAGGGDEFTSQVRELSVINDMYIMMEYNDTLLLFSPDQETVVPVQKYRNELPRLRKELEKEKNEKCVYYKFSTNVDKYSTVAYAREVETKGGIRAILYIFSPLYPVTSTVNILQSQLLNVTILAMILAFALSLYFSARLARPIREMTDKAKKMATGDYNVKYDVKSFTEINNLADTLNLTAYELAKQDERQKDLVANVSHDLKTPLTIIRSYAEMIRDLSGDIPEKRNAQLDKIIKETERMTNLVSDMSTITAMQTKKINLEKTYFDLGELAASVLSSFDLYQERDGYDFRLDVPKEESSVYADANRIKQVVTNLVSNAVKYCGEDKVIIVSVKKTGRKYRLEVSDHGPGISPEELSHVWDRYYKTSSNYVRPTEGTGLGLSIVKEILTLHHAQYGVVSKVGKGTSFWFELDMVR